MRRKNDGDHGGGTNALGLGKFSSHAAVVTGEGGNFYGASRGTFLAGRWDTHLKPRGVQDSS